jgi:hypothetical protein
MKKNHVSSFFDHFWTREHGLTNMLIMISVVNFVIVPLFGQLPFVRVLINVFWMLFLLAGIITMTRNERWRYVLVVIPAAYVVLRVLLFFGTWKPLVNTDIILAVCTFMILISLVFTRVFEAGPVTVHKIFGSIVVYLLIGNLFSIVFDFMYLELPGAFNINLTDTDNYSLHSVFLYFSYTTLTTTGFGDILPVHPLARTLVSVEQIIGVLYPVILIGRLVSLKAENPGNNA